MRMRRRMKMRMRVRKRVRVIIAQLKRSWRMRMIIERNWKVKKDRWKGEKMTRAKRKWREIEGKRKTMRVRSCLNGKRKISRSLKKVERG